ncbi:MAG: TonB family protein [Gemmatimonadaceae bacterium]
MSEAVAGLDSLHPGSDIDRTFAVPLAPLDSLVDRVEAARRDARYAQAAKNSAGPRYPDAERRTGIEGGVVSAIIVNADGRVDPATSSILYASAAGFETSVRDAFSTLRFEPARIDGQARCSLLVLPFIFALSHNGTERRSSYVLGEIGAPPSNVVSALPSGKRGVCPPVGPSSDGGAPIYLPCQIDHDAKEARSNAVLNWEPAAGEITPTSCFRAEVRFIVDANGVPEPGTAALISTNNPGFGTAVLALVPDLRFSPGRLKGRPVRQMVTHKETIGVVTTINSDMGHGSSTPSRRTRC